MSKRKMTTTKYKSMVDITPQQADEIFKMDGIDVEASGLEVGSEVCLKTGAKVYKTACAGIAAPRFILDGYNYNEGRDLERYAEVIR